MTNGFYYELEFQLYIQYKSLFQQLLFVVLKLCIVFPKDEKNKVYVRYKCME